MSLIWYILYAFVFAYLFWVSYLTVKSKDLNQWEKFRILLGIFAVMIWFLHIYYIWVKQNWTLYIWVIGG